MSAAEIEFQNGFLCGMATKGLINAKTNVIVYTPTVYNDSGVYSFFYINFQQAVQSFSLGMFRESIIITSNNAYLTPTAVESVDGITYKIYVDISTQVFGITVINKSETLLKLASGAKLPVFSVSFFVAGLSSYIKQAYIFESTTFNMGIIPSFTGNAYSVSLSYTQFDTSIVISELAYGGASIVNDVFTHLSGIENVTVTYNP
jgi:hypothetical protein